MIVLACQNVYDYGSYVVELTPTLQGGCLECDVITVVAQTAYQLC